MLLSVDIFCTSFEKPLEQSLFADYLTLLSPDLRERNSRYIRWQNRHSHLFGKLLLLKALRAYGIETDVWDYVAYNDNQRPCLTLDGVDFNISHSGKFVVCATGRNVRLGVDIEENKAVDFSHFRGVMSPDQWNEIENAHSPLKEFYKFWTIKESVIKADGRGFSIPLDKLEAKNGRVEYEHTGWFVQEITLDDRYSMALATDKLSGVAIHNIDLSAPYGAV